MKILQTLLWVVALWAAGDALVGAKASVAYHSTAKGYDASALVLAKAVFAGCVVVLVVIVERLLVLWTKKPS